MDLDEGIDFAIFLLGGFENELTHFYSRRIKSDQVVLDIGANIGAHTLSFSRLVGPGGKVIAIEATQFAVEKLRRNLELNIALKDNVNVHHALLVESADTTPKIQITSSWPLNGTTTDPLLDGGALKTVGQAKVLTLDELVEAESLTRLDWIKIDVDGNESSVLSGGVESLRRFRPHIIIEFSPYCHAANSFERLIGLLSDELQYTFFQIPKGKQLPKSAAELNEVIPRRGSINVLAVPHRETKGDQGSRSK